MRQSSMTARAFLQLAAAALFLCLVQAAPARADGMPMMLPDSPTPLVIETGEGARKFTVEIADDAVERERGLMFRKSMPDNHGMLFVFPGEGEIAFWMKNTIMPLDMVFIGSGGKIRAIKHGKPLSEANVSPGAPIQFVLELKAGTAQKDGIKVGDTVRHPSMDGAGPKG